MQTSENPLLLTDVYKMGHMEQYPSDTEYVYSYLEARKPDKKTVFFGLQYLLEEYLTKEISTSNIEDFKKMHLRILGKPVSLTVEHQLEQLEFLGHWPVEIRAVREGTIIDSKNVLMTLTNTKPGFHWCVGFIESLLLKVWYPCSVATFSYSYRNLAEKYAKLTCDNLDHLPFAVHDFGYRSATCEEQASIGGAAHLLNFRGSDTVTGNVFIRRYYKADLDIHGGLSVPASEHSVMCSFGKDNEQKAFDHIIETYREYPIISIVSDTYDLWNVLDNFSDDLINNIPAYRSQKIVFRPDSGNPVHIICGNPDPTKSALEKKGALQILWDKFGGTVNEKGYKVLDPRVGLIYGEGIYYERYEEMLERMMDLGFATSNLVIGVGGILMQNHSRDDYGFALKATYVERNGVGMDIFKDPITDSYKKSKTGRMSLMMEGSEYKTVDKCNDLNVKGGFLVPVYRNGELLNKLNWSDVREIFDLHHRLIISQ